jgi:tetraacyldisaccharide-1-P 4'-kinase
MRAKQSEIELFSAYARQVSQLLASNPVNFLEAVYGQFPVCRQLDRNRSDLPLRFRVICVGNFPQGV